MRGESASVHRQRLYFFSVRRESADKEEEETEEFEEEGSKEDGENAPAAKRRKFQRASIIKFSSLSAPTKIEELRCVFSSDPAVSSSIFVGAEREENLIGMIPTRASLQASIMFYTYTKITCCVVRIAFR